MSEEEEFQESEVIFSDNNNNITHEDVVDGSYFNYKSEKTTRHNKNTNTNKNKNKVTAVSSVPVNIPRHQFGVYHYEFEEFEGGDEEDDNLVPPHVILGRRIAGKMTFSVCTGNGRTLKGRDLSQVRNSILRMTGFLEV